MLKTKCPKSTFFDTHLETPKDIAINSVGQSSTIVHIFTPIDPEISVPGQKYIFLLTGVTVPCHTSLESCHQAHFKL